MSETRRNDGFPPPGFLDAASGQPLNPAAREAWLAAADAGWADSRRLYREGRRAALLAEAARESVAASLGARPDEVSFVTDEALPATLETLLEARGGADCRLVCSAVEHSSVLEAADRHGARGGEIVLVGVDRAGVVDAAAFRSAAVGGTVAVIQTANHEVGTRQPVAALAEACEAAGVPLIVDASMTIGREEPPAQGDVLIGRSATWGGPPGVGIVVVRRSLHLPPLDTPPAPLPAVIAAARGLEWADEHRTADAAQAREHTALIRSHVTAAVPDVVLLGSDRDRVDYLTAFSCLYVDGEALVLALDREGYAVSSGSSCVSDLRRPSHVLAAMGALTQGNVRVSLPFGVSDATVTGFLDTLPRVVAEVRAMLDADGLVSPEEDA